MVDPKKLSVKATYRINGEQTEMREFDGSTIKAARIGLPPNTPATKVSLEKTPHTMCRNSYSLMGWFHLAGSR